MPENPIIIVALALSFLVLGCDSPVESDVSDPAPSGCAETPSGDDILPLAEGNRWKYAFTRISSDGRVFERDPVMTEVGRSYVRPDGVVYEFRRYSQMRPGWAVLYGYQDESLYTRGGVAEGNRLGVDFLRYKYPVQVGNSYTMQRASFVNSADTWVFPGPYEVNVIATDTLIFTPAGEFQSIAYRYYVPPPSDVADGLIVTEYVAPGVGLVRKTTGTRQNPDEGPFHALTEFCIH